MAAAAGFVGTEALPLTAGGLLTTGTVLFATCVGSVAGVSGFAVDDAAVLGTCVGLLAPDTPMPTPPRPGAVESPLDTEARTGAV